MTVAYGYNLFIQWYHSWQNICLYISVPCITKVYIYILIYSDPLFKFDTLDTSTIQNNIKCNCKVFKRKLEYSKYSYETFSVTQKEKYDLLVKDQLLKINHVRWFVIWEAN